MSAFLHVFALLTAFGVVYWLNGPIWSLGGGGGGTGGPISVVLDVHSGAPPPPPEPEAATEPETKPKEPPKPKAEPPKAPEKVEEPPKIDPNAVPVPVKVVEKKKEPPKEPEKPKDPPKPDPPKEEKPKPVEKKAETKKEEKPAPKPTPKKEPVEVLPASQKTIIAKNTGNKPGPSNPLAGGTGGEGSGGLGPPGIPNLPPGLEGWGNSVRVKVLRYWAVPPGQPMTVDNYADVEFTVDRDGNILGEPKIIREGASLELGPSGLNAIIQTKRFPPFPTSFAGPRITVVYRFSLAP